MAEQEELQCPVCGEIIFSYRKGLNSSYWLCVKCGWETTATDDRRAVTELTRALHVVAEHWLEEGCRCPRELERVHWCPHPEDSDDEGDCHYTHEQAIECWTAYFKHVARAALKKEATDASDEG